MPENSHTCTFRYLYDASHNLVNFFGDGETVLSTQNRGSSSVYTIHLIVAKILWIDLCDKVSSDVVFLIFNKYFATMGH